MDAVFIAAAIFGLVLAFIMTVVAVRLLRDSRDRSTARVAALQAAVEAMESPVLVEAMDSPVLVEAMDSPVKFEAMESPVTHSPVATSIVSADEWDLALGEEFQAEPAARVVQPRHIRLTPVRTSNFDLRTSSSSHDLFEPAIEAAPSRRWQWMAAVVLVIAAGAGKFYAISSGVISRVSAADGPKPAAAPAAAAPIELLSLRNATDAGQFVVTGLVQNPAAGASMRDVFAVVYLFDGDGKYFASGRAALQSTVLSPGGEAAFVVKVPASMTVSRYRVSFQQQDGAGVVHVDRRGTLPEGTTGDSVEPVAPASAPNSALSGRKNR